MIGKDEMMSVLVIACPTFAPEWQAFLDEWRDQKEDLPLYIALGQLARHLCGMLAQGDTATFPSFFQAVERLHVQGDKYVREAACVGLLEDLQNLDLHSGTKPEQFRPYLGTESERCWSELNRFWSAQGFPS